MDVRRIESRVEFDKSTLDIESQINFEEVCLNISVKGYIDEIMSKHAEPKLYLQVAFNAIKHRHLTLTKKITSKMIDMLKPNPNVFTKELITHLENETILLAGEIENDIMEFGLRFVVDFNIVNEADQLLRFFMYKVIDSKLPMEELMQYSDKLKIERFLTRNVMEEEIRNWKIKRSNQLTSNNSRCAIDLNSLEYAMPKETVAISSSNNSNLEDDDDALLIIDDDDYVLL